MSNGIHWGGISGKSLCKAVLSDLWMVFAVMVIAWLGLGIVGSRMSAPSYTSSSVVAVYPYNQMETLETTSYVYALSTVSSANEVFNSEMFSTGLKERLNGPEEFSLSSQQIVGTYILMLSASSPSPENAYRILRAALDYYEEISSRLVGDNHLEVLFEPDFPSSPSSDSVIRKYRLLLTLFAGFAMGCFLVLMYIMRRTYKTESAVRRSYNNVRFFAVQASASRQFGRKGKKKSVSVPDGEAAGKTALELLQMLRAKNDRSVLITSAAPNEGKTEMTCALAREMAGFGKRVIILEMDPEGAEKQELTGLSDNLQEVALSYLLQDGANLESIAEEIPDRNIRIIFATGKKPQEEFHYTVQDVVRFLEQAGKLADIILVEGCVWTGSRDEWIWKNAADTSLAVCRQDQANFYAINRMMTDLRENDPETGENRGTGDPSDFLGCILYGF